MEYEIVVPEGMLPGQSLQANVAGRRVVVNVPQYLGPGRKMRIRLPAAAPAAAASQQMYRVIVPNGLHAGMRFQANVDGRVLSVTVPPGHGPGSTLTIRAPAGGVTADASSAPFSTPQPKPAQRMTATDVLQAAAARRAATAAKREAEAQARAQAPKVRETRLQQDPTSKVGTARTKAYYQQAHRQDAAPPLQQHGLSQQNEPSALWWLNMGL